MSRFPDDFAIYKGVSYVLFGVINDELYFKSSWIMGIFCLRAASKTGVSPWALIKLGSAPALSKSLTLAVLLFITARWSGVIE